jgi:hypothetical protein
VANALFVLGEVLEKEPSVASLWLWSLAIGLIGFAASRWRWWLGAPFLLVGLLFMQSIYFELADPFVGPAIRREGGLAYQASAILSGATSILLPLAGILHTIWRRRAVTSPN